MTSKAVQKVACKEKAVKHAADLAMGLTREMQKIIKEDTLICSACGATSLGPEIKCSCPGGKTRPGDGYDAAPQLLEAAKQRHAIVVKGKMVANAARQGSVVAAKAKKKEEKALDGLADLDLSTLDYCEVRDAAAWWLRHGLRVLTCE